MKSIFIILFFVLTYLNVQAQQKFQLVIDSNSYSNSLSFESNGKKLTVKPTLDKGYIIVAPTTNSNTEIIKLDSIGKVKWSIKSPYNLILNSVCVCVDGNFVAAGTYSGSNDDGVLIKFTNTGSILWSKSYNKTSNENFYSVIQTKDSGFVVTGWIWDNQNDILLQKTDKNGNLQWFKSFGSNSEDIGYSVSQTADNGYIITGKTMNSVKSSTEIALIKTNSVGDSIWTSAFGISDIDKGYHVEQTSDGGFIIAGAASLVAIPNIAVYKVNSLGKIEWAKTYSESGTAFSIKEVQGGGYFLIADAAALLPGRIDYDIVAIRLSSNGNVKWNKVYGGFKENEFVHCLEKTNDNGYIIGGFTKSFGDIISSASSFGNIYIIKTDTLGNSNSCYEKTKILNVKNLAATNVSTQFQVQNIINEKTETFIFTNINPSTYIASTIVSSIQLTNPTCYGYTNGSAISSPTGGSGGYIYNWSGINYGNSKTINNLGVGLLKLAQSDSNGCAIKDSILITSPSEITSTPMITNVSCYGGSNGSIEITAGGATSPFTYSWNNSQTTIKIQNLTWGSYSLRITDSKSCTKDFNYSISQPDDITYSSTIDSTICAKSKGKISLSVMGGTTPYIYNWSTGETTSQIQNLAKANYSVTISDAHSCSKTALYAVPTIKTVVPTICIVTLDDVTWKNMVVWERKKGFGIKRYNIFKETTTNNYSYLGSVLFDNLSVFVDLGSTPKLKAEKYKISITDSCNIEGSKSPYHQTMNLSKLKGANQNELTLIWNKYIDESDVYVPDEYKIVRGMDSSSLTLHDQMSGGFSSYNYNITDAKLNEYFQVTTLKTPSCVPLTVLKASSGPFSQSISNLEDNRIKGSDINEINNQLSNLSISPVPFIDYCTLKFTLNTNADIKIEVSTLLGDIILKKELSQINIGKYNERLDLTSYANGIYIIRILVNDSVYTQKIQKIK